MEAGPSTPPLLAVTMGDPAGIGAEIILKTARAIVRSPGAPRLLVVGDLAVMCEAARRLGRVPKPFAHRAEKTPTHACGGVEVIETGRLSPRGRRPGRPSVEGAEAAYNWIVAGARMALDGEVDGLVTAPINKQWLNRAGHAFPGHSELLAEMARVRTWRMMFAGERLRVALATVHMALSRVSAELKQKRVFDTIRLLAAYLTEREEIPNPRIAVLGFNPHAGEGGLFGDEEKRVIAPAIRRARRGGIGAFGPLAPDTAFVPTRGGGFDFDGAVAMYHDQGLIAVKTLEFGRAVNVTLGLPFIRTSPDHGTAYDIAGSGGADPASMTAAIEYAAQAARRRDNGGARAAR